MEPNRRAHVRPRPPSDGRPHPRQVRAAAPPREALRRYRPVGGGRRMPLPASLVLIVVVVLVAAGILFVGTGFATRAASQFGAAVADAVHRAASQPPATPPPSGVQLDTPQLDPPANGGYTNRPAVSVTGLVPGAVAGKAGYTVRVYSVVNGTRTQVGQATVGATVRFSVSGLKLVEGENTFVARLAGPTGEGEESPPIHYILDTKPPAITLSGPANNARTTSAAITVSGTTAAGSTVTIRNDQVSGTGASAQVGDNGKFQGSVALAAGSNTLVVTVTDPAGNTATAQRSVRRDMGQLAAHLTASPTRFSASGTQTLALTVQATASDGSPLAGATAVFTVQISGVPPIVSNALKTSATGAASFQTVIRGATAGTGVVSVLVTMADGTTVSGQVKITTY